MSESQATPSSGEALVGHIVKRGIPLIVLALVVVGAYYFIHHVEAGPKVEAAAPPAAPMPVTVFAVKAETVPVRSRYLGRTEASQTIEIRSRVAGYLLKRTFEEGSHVDEGQPLFQIDTRPFEIDLERAKAHLMSAQATLTRAQAQVKRYEELTQRQSATQGELEEWQQQEGVAAADVELARAEIDAAKLNIDYATIKAPVAGMIGKALKEVGSYVDSGSAGMIAELQQEDPMDVRFSVTEREVLNWQREIDAGRLSSPGFDHMDVQITLSDGSVYPQLGHIDFVDIKVDQTTGTMIIRAKVPNGDHALKPGQFVHVDMLGVKRINTIRVPQNVVLQDPSGARVYVVSNENAVEARPVTLGQWSGDDYWIIEKGLKDGDRVITNRLMVLRPGAKVEVQSTTSEAASSDGKDQP